MTVPPPTSTAIKADWRAWARTLDSVPGDVTAAMHDIVRPVLGAVDGPILGYLALDDELTCPPGATILPRLGSDGSMTLHLAEAELEIHVLGFAQPRPDAPSVDADEIAAVLVPGRVFDRDGYRLGRGGGHYDRLLPRLRSDTPIIGVTCSARLVDQLPREDHDVPMTHLATEHTVISTR